MKSKVRKALSAVFASLTAVFMGLSVVCCQTENNSSSGNNSSENSGLIDVTDSLGSKLDSSQFMNEDLLSSAKTKGDGSRRVIVELENSSLLDVYLSSAAIQRRYSDLTSFVNAAEGRQYASELTAQQAEFISALNRTSVDYEVRHSYSSVINGVSLVIDDSDVSAVENLPGVKNVIYSESYAVPTVEATMNDVSVYSTGIYDSENIADEYGYTGNGMVVAVLDTGFDRSHAAFQRMPAEENQGLTYSQVLASFNDLEATTQGGTITINDVYYNAKVPFAYDYADNDPDVFPKSSSHGLHVAGVIGGYQEDVAPSEGEAFENNSTFRGVAPDAQLVICKVFPDEEDGLSGGAETDDILAALSDCITLGVDVINMSLGVSAGFSREEDGNAINDVYDKVYDAGINLVVAASNEGSSAQNGAYGTTNLTGNPDSGTVGSPSTYASALSVASISGQLSSYLQLSDGTAIYFNESSTAAGEQGDFVAEILDNYFEGADSAEVNFITIPGYGANSNYTTAIRNQMSRTPTIAVVSRGVSSFEDKQRIAFENGAIGCIIYNNMSGRISASLGTGKEIPTCTITADIGQTLVSMGSGAITINRSYKAGPFMSSFSSWGPTPDLKIKPEITAHGGEITSTVVGGYSIYSGTSMASPNMAGAVTLLRQYVSEYYGLSGVELADRVNSLLMSTATIINDERGLPYAVRRQGAGLGDIYKAISSNAYISVENSTKPKLELGDDPNKTGVYTMEFTVNNVSDTTKTYSLDAYVMTESVSIDNITVSEQSYMLDGASKTFYVNGTRGNTVTVAANSSVQVKAVIELTDEEKDYLDENFENGMYVEGFITLSNADEEGVDLSVPYLAFYGDWLAAPIFDHTTYEVSADEHNSAIEDADKTVAAVYESVAIGRYYRGTETYIPLGQYVYDSEGGDESGIEAMVDKIAVGNSDYGVYEFYAVYFGLLRSVEEMEVEITNSATGEVVWSDTLNMIGKSYSSAPSYAEIGLQPREYNLQNNTQYTATFKTRINYNGRTSEEETQVFTFYVDYEAPFIYRNEYVVRYEYDVDDTTLRHAYLDLYLYDNHYVQSVQLFTYADAESNVDWATDTMGEVDWLTEYAIPVDSSRGAVNRVTVEITDYLDNLITYGDDTDKYIGVRIDDYALNSTAYLVPVQTPEVSKVDLQYTRGSLTGSLENGTILMTAGDDLDLGDDTADIVTASGETLNGVTLDLKLYNYAIYTCAAVDAHGATCGFRYDEHEGYTYSEGDYYYDSTLGSVRRIVANENLSIAPYTLFTSLIATGSGSDYTSTHFVCPDCGTEVTFTYNRRTQTISPNNFSKLTPDAMSEEVVWWSSDESVVRVWNGRLYAAGAGTATIYAYAPDGGVHPYPATADGTKAFSFNVEVEGAADPAALRSISISAYDNLTLGTSRKITTGAVTVENGTRLVLYADVNPWYVDDSRYSLNWSVLSSVVDGVVFESEQRGNSVTVLCAEPGTYTVSASYGIYSGSVTITVGEDYVLTSTYFYEYNGPGYTETVDGRKVLVIPADLGITNLGQIIAGREGPFLENTDLDTVIVPEAVTTIGYAAFRDSSIRRIYLPSSLINIAQDAFAGCTNLEEVYWYDASEDSNSGIVYDGEDNTYNWEAFFDNAGEKITSQSLVIGPNAFDGCVKLNTFDFSKVVGLYDFAFNGCLTLDGTVDLTNLRFSGVGVFNGCSGITGVQLDGNTVLNAYMFSGTGITSVDYYGSFVADMAFANMPELTSVTFNSDSTYSNVYTIGNRAFENCPKLKNVSFNRSFTSIGDYAFAGTALETIELPASLTALGSYAFADCASLASVVVDSSSHITSMGAGVFSGCGALASIGLSDGGSEYYNELTSGAYSMITDKNGNPVLVPPAYSVSGDENVITIGTGLQSIGALAYANNASLDGKTLIIAEGVTSIGNYAFADTGITRVIIPASVTSLGQYAFADCENLASVVFLGNISEIPAGLFSGCSGLESISIPESVTLIGDSAFDGAGLKSVEIGRNVVSIGNYAFADNARLSAISFAPNARLETLGDSAFEGCTALTSVSLPDGVASIGARAFYGAENLRSVYISSSLEEMGAYAFANNTYLTTVTFGDGAKVVGDYAFAAVSDGEVVYQNYLANVTLPASVTSIGNYAFAGNAALTTLSLPGVDSIGSHAFYNTPALSVVTLKADGTDYIGVSAFENSAIRTVNGLDKVTSIDARAFYDSDISSVNGVFDLSGAVEIGEYAFYNCLNITGDLILTNAEQIYAAAFYVPFGESISTGSQGNIQYIELGDNLKGLGGGAFFNSAIVSITLPSSLEIVGTPAFSGCLSLSRISMRGSDGTYFAENGALYKRITDSTYELVAVPNGLGNSTQSVSFTIKDGTVRIGEYAMAYCRYLSGVTIPASVKSIGAYAFYYLGMAKLDNASLVDSLTPEDYPEYIFEGLEAPALETHEGEDEGASLTSLYFNFSYDIGYQLGRISYPVNANGFDSPTYEFCFAIVTYTDEVIEENTQSLVDALTALNVDALTEADADMVNSLNLEYTMLTSGQRTFITAELLSKLNAAMEKVGLTGETPGGDQPGDEGDTGSDADAGSSCQSVGVVGGNGGFPGGGALVAVLGIIAVLAIVRSARRAAVSNSNNKKEGE